MSRSLRDQLLQAGVASKQQVQNVASEKRKKKKRKTAGPSVDQGKQQLQKAQAEKALHDRELNRLRKEKADDTALTAQVRQLIDSNRLSREGGDTPYSFADGKKVRKIYVLEDMAVELAQGRLAIARVGDGFEIVPQIIAEKISERDDTIIVVLGQSDAGSDEDDAYADYPVPDDLRW